MSCSSWACPLYPLGATLGQNGFGSHGSVCEDEQERAEKHSVEGELCTCKRHGAARSPGSELRPHEGYSVEWQEEEASCGSTCRAGHTSHNDTSRSTPYFLWTFRKQFKETRSYIEVEFLPSM